MGFILDSFSSVNLDASSRQRVFMLWVGIVDEEMNSPNFFSVRDEHFVMIWSSGKFCSQARAENNVFSETSFRWAIVFLR